MYCTPCARLMKSITPNTSVSPAATRKSSTPNCSPFSTCTSRSCVVIPCGADAASAHAAFGGPGVHVVLQHLPHSLGLELAVGALRHLAQPEVLHRELIGAEAEPAAHRGEVRGGDRLAQRVLVGELAAHLADCAVEQEGRVVAVRGVGRRDV